MGATIAPVKSPAQHFADVVSAAAGMGRDERRDHYWAAAEWMIAEVPGVSEWMAIPPVEIRASSMDVALYLFDFERAQETYEGIYGEEGFLDSARDIVQAMRDAEAHSVDTNGTGEYDQDLVVMHVVDGEPLPETWDAYALGE